MQFFSKFFKPIKITASNNFMKNIEAAKKESNTDLELSKDSFEDLFQNAVITLKEFASSQNHLKLKEAGIKFFKLIKQKQSRVEPYVYLSYILFLFDQKDEAIKYLRIAESLDSSYRYIKEVKACIYNVN